MPRQFGVPADVIDDVTSGALTPNAYSAYLELLHDRHVIGVNNAYKIGNWIDVIFFGDCSWYLVHRKQLAQWPGVKVTCCPRFASKTTEESEGIKYLQKDKEHRYGISANPRKVAWNSNSGAAAISLAVHLGVDRIFLLGFDMMTGENDESHWHSPHNKDKPRKSPPFQRHMKGFPNIATDAKAMGVDILNISPNSAIEHLPKYALEDIV